MNLRTHRWRAKARAVVLLLASLIPALTAHAVAYYIDNCRHVGNDSNLGNTPTSPWRTIDKINKISLYPGDIIRLRRGCIWSETLRPRYSGQLGRPIIFSAYGIGPKPLLHAGAVVGHHWVAKNQGLYVFDPHGFASGVFRNDVPLRPAPSLAALRTSQQYFYDGQFIWIRSVTDPNASLDRFDISQRSTSIEIHNVAHLRFQGLRTAYASGTDVDASHSSDIALHDVDGLLGGGAGFYCQAGSYDIHLTGGTWSGAGWNGKDGDDIAIGGNDPTGSSFSCRNLVLEGAQLYGSTEACVAVDTTFKNFISSDIQIIGNFCHDSRQYGIFVGGGHRAIVIQSNVIARNGRSGIVFGEGTSGTPSGIICNNTLWSNGAQGKGDDASNIDLQSSGVLVSNNLVAHANGPEIAIAEGRSPKFDHNLYWHPSGGSVIKQGSATFSSAAAWNGARGEQMYDVYGDPHLRDPGHDDYRPNPGSPVLYAGKDLGRRFGLGLCNLTSIFTLKLVRRPSAVPWNIGAY